MRILRHGRLDLVWCYNGYVPKNPIQFSCTICECIFEADELEYEVYKPSPDYIKSKCPECSSTVLQKHF